MEPDDLKPIEHLDSDECWRLLRTTSVGRLAVSVSDMPDIFPVNYVVSNGHMLFRTAPGSKLAHVAVNKQVAFEADGMQGDRVWSVVVKGTALILDKRSDIDAAEELLQHPMLTTDKFTFVEITAKEISGISFLPGPKPRHL